MRQRQNHTSDSLLLETSLPTLATMDTWQGLTPAIQPSAVSHEAVDVVITFRSTTSPIYLSVDAVNHWEPQLMSSNGEAFEHVITVPRDTRLILYKFRIGDNQWVHDAGICAGIFSQS